MCKSSYGISPFNFYGTPSFTRKADLKNDGFEMDCAANNIYRLLLESHLRGLARHMF